MASDNPSAAVPNEPSENTPSARPATRTLRRLRGAASILLLVGAVMQLVAFYLPWEHLVEFYGGVLGDHIAVDLPVYNFLVSNPGIAYARLLFGPALGRESLAGATWDTLWHAMLPLIGLLLVLMLLTWTRRLIRWPISILYALWLALTTAQAVNFAKTIADIAHGTARFDPHAAPAWWQRLIGVGVTISGEPGHPPGLAWGYWIFVAALAVSWLALGLTIFPMLRGTDARYAQAPEGSAPEPWRRPLAAILITVGAVVWIASLLALPMVAADCGSSRVRLTPGAIQQCQRSSAAYPLQVIALRPFVEPPPADIHNPANETLGMLEYFRDFALLVLAMAVAPLALVIAWRAHAMRGRAIWLSFWAALMLVETGLLLWAAAELIAPDPRAQFRTVFSADIGPSAVLIPAGVVLVIAGVVLYWRDTLRHDPGAASILDVPSQAA